MPRVGADEPTTVEEPDVLIMAVCRSAVAEEGVEPHSRQPHRRVDVRLLPQAFSAHIAERSGPVRIARRRRRRRGEPEGNAGKSRQSLTLCRPVDRTTERHVANLPPEI